MKMAWRFCDFHKDYVKFNPTNLLLGKFLSVDGLPVSMPAVRLRLAVNLTCATGVSLLESSGLAAGLRLGASLFIHRISSWSGILCVVAQPN
jgi:hypothetical protein